ncbi:SPOSA6832_03919 [Sporobolomyces salmonicolor]|uniref:SPOSA6832_03919-mRNA-1:cds n=1 Tax=Sporidiobolus salmonicolor TaxID=5005 RepID=A0A0D6EQJ1_SPOSA|nr:SPOSA6832_03919 [Sporobolomyces salmonicolor]
MLRSLSKPKSIPSLAAAASTTTSFASKMLAAFSSKSSSSTPSPAPTPPPSKKDKEPLDFTTVTLFLRAVAATLKVSPSSHFHTEMVRATKKALPSMTRYSLIWTGKDEFDASQGNEDDEAEVARRVFSGLLSSLDVQGRVSIGFPTFQTTGNASSVGARFISTVERESLDFQAKYVADWNRELLWAGGVLARTVFEEEMAEIARLWKARPTLEAVERTRLEERALHLIKFFSFSRSTPQDIVGAMTEASFFASNSGTSLTLISSIGPTAAHKLRLPNSQLAGFIKEIPVVPELVNTNAPHFLAVLRDKGFIRDISLEDVFADLASHPLSIAEATECFKWWASLASNRSYDVRLLGRLQEAAMLSVPSPTNKDDFRIYPLGGFKTYLNPKTVSVDLPLPEHTLPFELSRHFSANDLSRVFQFSELSLVAWVRHLLSPSMVGKEAKVETNLLKAPPFAERVLAVLAKGWAQVPTVQQKELVTILAEQAFVPTRLGPRKPSESYLPNVVLFDDLAITTLPSGAPIKGNMEKLLLALGVRRHVELQLVFTRLLGAGDWSHIQLVRYLVSVKDTLSATELDRLRKTSWLPKEGEAKVESPAGADGVKPKPKTIRHMAGDLYEVSLLPKLLYDLGLLRTPPVEQVLQIAASPASPERQEKALRYFLDGCVTLGYGSTYSPSKHAFPFVPAVEKGKATLAKPMEVFGNPEAAVLGFPILSSKYAAEESRFRILRDPPSSALVAALVGSPPQTIEEASKIFSYLSSQVSHFASADMEALSWATFVPIRRPGGKVEILPPLNLFFKSDENLPAGLRSLFTTIPDFGLAARPFLVACGVKESPSTLEVASMLIADPPRFYDLAGSAERYLSILRLLALNYSSLSSTLRSRMKMSAFFLGTKRILNTSSSNNKTLLDDDSDDDEGSETLVYQLARASELAINDEPAAFRVFQADILACPQEDALEALAEQLGAHRISRIITEQYRTVGEPDEGAKRAVELHRAVAERTFLFLSERRQQYGKGELKHDPDWIQSHLQVYEVRSIELIRTLKSAQGLKKSSHAASACAQLAKNGDVALYIAQNIDVDYYEVAMSLCKLLLSKLRPNDALLLLTILQTTLRNLKRRGFNVDRILNARKAEKEAADQRMREERLQAQLKVAEALSPEKLAAYTQQLSNMFPDADPDFLRTLLQTQDAPQLENAANQLLASPHYPKRRDSKGSSGASLPSGPFQQQSVASPAQHQPPTTSFSSGGLFSNFRKQFARPEPRPSSPLPPPPSLTPPAPTVPPERPAGMVPGPSRPATTPTSTDAIRANLTRAIQHFPRAFSGKADVDLCHSLRRHDKMVQEGKLEEPLISTFHTLAHELAHSAFSLSFALAFECQN